MERRGAGAGVGNDATGGPQEGNTALHKAAERGDKECVALLLKHAADACAQNKVRAGDRRTADGREPAVLRPTAGVCCARIDRDHANRRLLCAGAVCWSGHRC